eukprot:jgi/Orpsp1_1/1186311/evm.model.d7180000049651.1
MAAAESSVDITDVAPSSVEPLNPKIEDNELKKVTYLGLFKYSSMTEKIMVVLGILGSIGQGVTMPIMIEVMGDLINIFMNLVASVTVRKLTGIQND